jgi:hypothetical protein
MRPTAAACPEADSAAVPAKPPTVAVAAATVPAAMSAKACAVSSATMSAAAMSPAAMSPAATMSAATAAAAVCFECEKRHDEEQHRSNASAGRQHRSCGAAGLGPPRRRGRLRLSMPPRAKRF